MDKVYLITEQLRSDLLAYLVQRPYAEVAKGVEQLLKLEPVPAPAPPPPPVLELAKG